MNSKTIAAWAAALLLAGCGGGGTDPQTSTCTLTNPAGCGGSPPPVAPVIAPVTPPVTPSEPATLAESVSLLFSSAELKSAGAPGSEVSVTAVVKNSASTALAGAKIVFSADSGILTGPDLVTDKNGQAKVMLGTGASNANRSIKVQAKVGDRSASGAVDVVGTTIAVNGPAALNLGQSTDLTVTLRDSAGAPVGGAAVTLSAKNGNTLTAKGGAEAKTNSQGQIGLSLLGTRLGEETVSVAARGASASKTVSVTGTELSITPALGSDAAGAELMQEVATGVCQPVDVRYQKLGVGQSGTVELATSRGRLYSDNACSQALAGALTLAGGLAPRSYVSSVNAGIATLVAGVGGGPSALTRIEFVAPLTAAAGVNLQAEPAVIGSNASGAQGERSTLTAVVRDGTPANNLVKGVSVVYAILADPSGGYLLQPSSASTGSDGVARAVYVAGPADSGKDGAVIEARIQGTAVANGAALTRLTVAKKALSIQIGTGNQVFEYSTSLLQQEFSVLVSDGAGNAVPGVSVSASVWPLNYRKGYFVWQPDTPGSLDPGFWVMAAANYVCANEDLVRKGVYDRAYDLNGNGILDPGIPTTVSSGGKTDALGLSTIKLNYPRDHGHWAKVELTVRATVAGTESSATWSGWLYALSKDFSVRQVSPPGQTSPYGTGRCDEPR